MCPTIYSYFLLKSDSGYFDIITVMTLKFIRLKVYAALGLHYIFDCANNTKH